MHILSTRAPLIVDSVQYRLQSGCNRYCYRVDTNGRVDTITRCYKAQCIEPYLNLYIDTYQSLIS